MNDFLYPSHSKIYEKDPRYREEMLPVPWSFVKSSFHCIEVANLCQEVLNPLGAAGWGHIFTTGLTMMWSHFQEGY